MAESKDPKPAGESHATVGGRLPFTPPELTAYGTIARLTQSGGTTLKESGVPKMRKNCL